MRTSNTYRGARRNEWKLSRALSTMPWNEWNAEFYPDDGYGIGFGSGKLSRVAGTLNPSRSQYMPHNGKAEMARRVRQMEVR